MAIIEFTEQEANIILEALNVSIKQIGLQAAAPYAVIANKVTSAFNIPKEEVLIVEKTSKKE